MRYTRLLIGTLVTVGLLAGLWVSPASAQPGFNPPGLERAIEAQEYHTNSLMAVPGVVGTAVGLGAGGQPVVKIYTESAGVAGLPRSLDGVPVVVQVIGKIFALKHECGHRGPPCEPEPDPDPNLTPTDRWPRPVPIGVSTGHPDITAGTIGARVIDSAGYVYALSNNHIYADENFASMGNNVLQPGPFDGGAEGPDPNVIDGDEIGTLFDFEPIVFSTTANNTIDAAIALSSTANLGNATPSDGYETPNSAIVSAAIWQAVQKYGRTTSLTKGEITGINASVFVGYSSGTALFVDQIIVESRRAFIKGGDSGSLLVVDGGEHDLKPVGLLFAGNRSGKLAVANQINLVLDAFGVTIAEE